MRQTVTGKLNVVGGLGDRWYQYPTQLRFSLVWFEKPDLRQILAECFHKIWDREWVKRSKPKLGFVSHTSEKFMAKF